MRDQSNKTRVTESGNPHIFGIRHLSPAGAWHLRTFLDRIQPQLVMIEGPSDFTELIPDLAGEEVKPPVAIMAYTLKPPIRTILYPFAVYSPEYQAVLWAAEHGCRCEFCDLPSEIFLALDEVKEKLRQKRMEEEVLSKKGEASGQNGQPERTEQDAASREGQNPVSRVYSMLDELSEDGSQEVFWERTLEQAKSPEGYRKGTDLFGCSLRELTLARDHQDAENLIREAYMRKRIQEAIVKGIPGEKIVVVTGAFHVEGLQGNMPPMTEKELDSLPRLDSRKTLMPYSYYRLSEHSGYGAGNQAPAYYELLWDSLHRGEDDYSVYSYFTRMAEFQRNHGMLVSSAEVIEAVRLSYALAALHDSGIPVLKDLRDAAITCMGHGKFSEIALAAADTEIGTRIGSLPEGISQTSIQADFYGKLKELRLEKYKSAVSQDLALDLREKLRVSSQKAAFMDLERSFFLHRLRVLGIHFGSLQNVRQDRATWAEHWILQWTEEAEIQIVEAVLKGNTVEQAVSFQLKEQVEDSKNIAELAHVMEETFYCGMPENVIYALKKLQELAVDAVSVQEIARTASSLSVMVQFGDIRNLNREPLIPVISQLFLRACLILPEECHCDDEAAASMAEAIDTLNRVIISHEFLDEERWERVLLEIAGRDDLNTKLSGFAAAVLLEKGVMDSEELGREVERRLSKGIPAELGAGWFEGLSMKNHYALIARLVLWEKLSDYLDILDEEEFKRALVFLRRTFADFSSEEKNQVAENLGEIWNVDPIQVSAVLNSTLPEETQEMLGALEDFDFDDI